MPLYTIKFTSTNQQPYHLRFGPEGKNKLGYMRDGFFETDNICIGGSYFRTLKFGGAGRQDHVIIMETDSEIWQDGVKLIPNETRCTN